MKKFYTLLAILASFTLFAQAPQGFNYQATVRNASGALIANQNVYFKFNLMLNSQTTVPVYSETHYLPSDDLGQVNLTIGTGTPTIGAFSEIDWGSGNFYLGIELNTGNGYVAMGTTQLLSVPYALYAQNAASAAIPNLASVLTKSNSANNTKITDLADPVSTQDAANKAYVDALIERISVLENRLFINNNSVSVNDIDNNTYATLKFGTQIWTKENLNVSKYSNGDVIPQVTDPSQWANLTTGAWCYYNNDPTNEETYGKLYNWYAVNDQRGLAPQGWHIPSDIEWKKLFNLLGSGYNVAGKMREPGTAHWNSPNDDATNESGFTLLPAGGRFPDSNQNLFVGIGDNAFFWNSNEVNSTNSNFIQILNTIENIGFTNTQKTFGLSIRCIKD